MRFHFQIRMFLLFAMFAVLLGCDSAKKLTNPVPVITSLVPPMATAGGAAFTLTVNGSGFTSSSVVDWNSNSRTTMFGSATQITAQITAADIASAGTANVTVVNPAPGGGTSNSVTFQIAASTPTVPAQNLPAGAVQAGYTTTSLTESGGTGPFTWALNSAANTFPPGLSLSTAGAISGTPTTEGTYNFSVKVTDSKSNSGTGNLSITIAPASLALSPATLPSLTIGVAAQQTITATPATTGPYTWTVTSGSLPTGLELSGNTNSTTSVTTAGNTVSVTGTPTTAGNYSFTLKVADAEAPNAGTGTANFSGNVAAGSTCAPAPGNLCGPYVLFMQGFTATGPYALAASFVADGKGGITSGVIDINSMSAPVTALPVVLSSPTAFNFENNGFGNVVFNTTIGDLVFKFALNSTGTYGTVVQFQPSPTTTSGTGFLAAQDATAFHTTLISGHYGMSLIGGLGGPSSGVRVGMIGPITADGNCGFSAPGTTATVNSGGTVSHSVDFSGTLKPQGSCNIDSKTGRGTGTFTMVSGSPATSFTALDFTFYVIGQSAGAVNQMVLISSDQSSATQPMFSGLAVSQVGAPYSTNASLDCGVNNNPTKSFGCIFASTGATNGEVVTGGSHVVAGRATVSTQSQTTGALILVSDENKAGVITTNSSVSASYSYLSSGNGVITPTTGSIIDFVLTGVDSGFTLGEGNSVSAGIFLPQTSLTLNTSAAQNFLAGTYAAGTSAVTTTSATATQTPAGAPPSNTGAFSGSTRFWNSSSFQNVSPLTGNYTTDATTGRGTGATDINGAATIVYYTLDENNFILVGVAPADSAGALLIFKQP